MNTINVEVRIKPNPLNTLLVNSNQITLNTTVYNFSAVHTGSTTEVFRSLEPLLTNDTTVICYGQTGSGKTYTMGIGSEDGLLHHAIRNLFNERIEGFVSFYEIYNEQVFDLLGLRVPLKLMDNKDGLFINGLSEHRVDGYEMTIEYLNKGIESRVTKKTGMNEKSSRSHAVFIVRLDSKIYTFVDLAGSERLKRTRVDGRRCVSINSNIFMRNGTNKLFKNQYNKVGNQPITETNKIKNYKYEREFVCNEEPSIQETISINTGLLALGSVINALSKRANYVPYRSSRLTRILQKPLTANVLLIACVSGLQIDYNETSSTLEYAVRAASIVNRVVVNYDPAGDVVNKLKKEVLMLKAENKMLKDVIDSKKCICGLSNRVYGKDYGNCNSPFADRRIKVDDKSKIKEIIKNENIVKNESVVKDGNITKNGRVIENKRVIKNENVIENVSVVENKSVIENENVIENKSVVKNSCPTKNVDITKKNAVAEPNNIFAESKLNLNANKCGLDLSDKVIFTTSENILNQPVINKQKLEVNSTVVETESKKNNCTNKELDYNLNSIGKSPLTKAINIFEEVNINSPVVKKKKRVTFADDVGVAVFKKKHKMVFTPSKTPIMNYTTSLISSGHGSIINMSIGKYLYIGTHGGLYSNRANEIYYNKSIGAVENNGQNLLESDNSMDIDTNDYKLINKDIIISMHNNNDLLSYSTQNATHILDTRINKIIKSYDTAGVVNLDGNSLGIGCEDGNLRIVDIRNDLFKTHNLHSKSISCLCIKNNIIYTGSEDNTICSIDTLSSNESKQLSNAHYGNVSSLLFSSHLISTSFDCSIKLWNDTNVFKTVPYAHPTRIMGGCLHKEFIVTFSESLLKVWCVENSVCCMGQIAKDIVDVCSNNESIFIATKDGSVESFIL